MGFELKDMKDWAMNIPEAANPEKMESLKALFELVAGSYERGQGIQSYIDAISEAVVHDDKRLQYVLGDAPLRAYMDAEKLINQCRFKKAYHKITETERSTYEYCAEAGAEYRVLEKQARCYRSRHMIYDPELNRFILIGRFADEHAIMTDRMEDRLYRLKKRLNQLDKKIKGLWQVYSPRLEAFKTIQQGYIRHLAKTEKTIQDKNIPEICRSISAFDSVLNKLTGDCRESIYLEDNLKSPDDIISEFNQIGRSQSRQLWGKLDSVEQSINAGDAGNAERLLKEVQSEMDSIVIYRNGRCTKVAPNQAKERIVALLDRLSAITEATAADEQWYGTWAVRSLHKSGPAKNGRYRSKFEVAKTKSGDYIIWGKDKVKCSIDGNTLTFTNKHPSGGILNFTFVRNGNELIPEKSTFKGKIRGKPADGIYEGSKL